MQEHQCNNRILATKLSAEQMETKHIISQECSRRGPVSRSLASWLLFAGGMLMPIDLGTNAQPTESMHQEAVIANTSLLPELAIGPTENTHSPEV